VEEIARHAGISVGSVYRYVRAKEDILFLIMRQIMTHYEVRVRPILAEPLPPQEKLIRFVEAYIRHIDQDQDGVMVLYRDAHALGRRIRSELVQTDRTIIGDIQEIIRDGVAEGIFRARDPDMVAHNIIAVSHVWVLRRWRFPEDYTVSDYIRTQIPLILAQLGVYTALPDPR
jgi:AcrR family transcriptional regulator